MAGEILVASNDSLNFHIQEVQRGNRKFESAAQSVSRMILEKTPEKKIHGGKTVYDFPFFREGSRHIIGWYEEISDFVHFIKQAAEGSSAAEMAYVLVSEPGNGKTFFVDFLCNRYRHFLSQERNRRYTFKFVGLDKALGYDKKVSAMESLTYEDPMVLAMNLFEDQIKSKEFLAKKGFADSAVEKLYKQRRPLGASTEYLWYELLAKFGGDVEKVLADHMRIYPVPMRESLGTTTGKYSAKDKITSSAVDLLGEESLQHLLLLKIGDPNKFDLRRGALARVAGGGVHFCDEIFKNKKDLVQIYLQVIQNRNIEVDGYIWPIDTLIIATSNNHEYNRFVSEAEESPIKDRCRVCYVGHNTDYKLQFPLTSYSMGSEPPTTIMGKPMHIDPNLIYATSVGVVLTRLLTSGKLDGVEMMKLEAGETAGEKGIKTLLEVKETANANPDVTKRWAQKGLGHRDLGRALQTLAAMPESNEGECLFAKDVFKALERVILDCVSEATDRTKFQNDLKKAKQLYREHMKTSIFNAYRDDPQAIVKDVMAYINSIVALGADDLGPDNLWRYRDPQDGEFKLLKIDTKYIESVESRLGLHSKETKESFRTSMRKIYGQKIVLDPNYTFMDNQKLVKAVTDVKLESDVAGAPSLVGALANRTNEENVKLHNRMVSTMRNILGYCPTCAVKTIEYFCEKDDDS